MQVSNNSLESLLSYYFKELENLYDRDEIRSLFITVVEHYLKVDREYFQFNLETKVNQSELILIYNCANELKSGKPLQYILNEAWFYNSLFFVNEHVLIPRPETEELIEIIFKDSKTASKILDIGCGSGCIILTLKKLIPEASCTGLDLSKGALNVTLQNSKKLNLPVSIINADVLELNQLSSQYDLIVSNPPYIKETEKGSMHKNVLEHEPHLALFVSGEDEIVFYKKIIDLCASSLNSGGKLYFELNPLTANLVLNYAKQSMIFKEIELIKDINSKDRFFKGIKL
ncbi:MAG: peptide chain release factor N(5)-glutamine methyltransferase [Bacteroidetes bacterium]|nr:peptide chain release factor N(5)-glutamine methyltransferase [Bacteroidota bacterium]MCA6443238.1 peptide chain release factor N(5)-glutamine methyltransferase [Bacteroidota bacterium]